MATATPHPARYDLIVIQGTDQIIPIRLELADGTLRDLTGCTAEIDVRANYGESTLLTLSTANGRISLAEVGTGASAYNMELFIPHAVSAALTNWGQGVWDCELTIDTGDVIRLWGGTAVLSREVTT